MTYYPIIIPTLNRYQHLKECIDSLSKNIHANQTELVISLDYPPSEKYIEGYTKIKEYIYTIQGFDKVTIFIQNHNLGSKLNTSFLVDYVSSKYDAYIYTEDDNIFSPFFLDYINKGLNKFKNDLSIMAICGYSYPIDWETDKNCVLQHQYFSAWGCGYWINKDKIYKDNFTKEFVLKEFKKIGSLKKWVKSPWNLKSEINFIFADNFDLFDITRSFYMYTTETNVLMPTQSLVSNMGWDGSGENCEDSNGIDFRNLNRNETYLIDISNCDIILSKNLERLLKKLIKHKNISVLILIAYKILGYRNLNAIRKFSKLIRK